MLDLAMIGLGDIARKAYLPVITATPDIRPLLVTRDKKTLDRIGGEYRIPEEDRFTDLDLLLQSGRPPRAALVHVPTETHRQIVEQLLHAGVDVYVDKPLDYTLEGAGAQVELARQLGRSLMVGFNRRYAPAYAELLQRPRDLILMRKNRHSFPDEPRRMIFDDFIHVVDTLRFLLPDEPEHIQVRARISDGLLHHVVLELSGEDWTALGLMNRSSGSTEEHLEVSGRDTKREVINIAEIIDHHGEPTVHRRGDWVPVARQRGIEQCVLTFLDAVRTGRILDAEDALRTHELCERIVQEITA